LDLPSYPARLLLNELGLRFFYLPPLGNESGVGLGRVVVGGAGPVGPHGLAPGLLSQVGRPVEASKTT